MNDKQLKIVNEILNDAFWLGYILEIKRGITDYSKKEILSSFLIFFSSIFVEETVKSNYGILSGKRKITLKEIEELRNYNLKYSPSTKSFNINEVIQEMGIDFEHYTFDIILSLNDNNLLDINFRNWNFNKSSNFELLDGIVATPLRWIEIIMPDIYIALKETLQNICNIHINKINTCNIYRKSYSSYKLFNNDINKDDKLYILQRYGLIKTTVFIENTIEDNISFDIGKFHFNFKNYITKAKSIILEMLWNDKKSNKSINIINDIFELNKKDISDNFYAINRKCRNNLHYSDYHYISKKDYEILINNQTKYLNNILLVFDEYITYKFGLFYKIGLSLAKLEYLSRTQNNKI